MSNVDLENAELELLDEVIVAWLDNSDYDRHELDEPSEKHKAVVALRRKLAAVKPPEATTAVNLYGKLYGHFEHEGVRLSAYGDANITLECEDEHEVIFDTDVYDLNDGNSLFGLLVGHVGHVVAIAGFGDPRLSRPDTLELHCQTCGDTLLDTDADEIIGIEDPAANSVSVAG
jgi:hypothetical protein